MEFILAVVAVALFVLLLDRWTVARIRKDELNRIHRSARTVHHLFTEDEEE